MKNERAKEIFFKFNGQQYHMAHDGFRDEYRKYCISEIIEEKWIEELIKLRLSEYKKTSDMIYLIPIVEYYNKFELLDKLLSIKIKGTYINKFVIIEMLSKLIHKNRRKIENYKNIKIIYINIVSNFSKESIPKKYEAYNVEERLRKIKSKFGMK